MPYFNLISMVKVFYVTCRLTAYLITKSKQNLQKTGWKKRFCNYKKVSFSSKNNMQQLKYLSFTPMTPIIEPKIIAAHIQLWMNYRNHKVSNTFAYMFWIRMQKKIALSVAVQVTQKITITHCLTFYLGKKIGES